MEKRKVLVIGAGLAGSDASYYLANAGIEVVLVEGKSKVPTPAQKMKTAAELVCTNSLKSMREDSAHGLLKLEMKSMGSLILNEAEKYAVPAGDALAVDRKLFSEGVHKELGAHPNITFIEEEATNPLELKERFGCSDVIVATGPLTTKSLENWITTNVAGDDLYFYDAIAPVIDADSLDLTKMYFKDRHDEKEGSGDYLNIPLNQDEYEKFVEELVNAQKVPPQDFEELKYFESCLPIDTMAMRGKDTPRFSCMKPIGLNRDDGTRPYAVIQLRKENLLGEAYNMVGFQTRLKYPEQLRVFRTLPGMEKAQFIHLGSIHRNTFLNAKKLFNFDLSLKENSNIYFAGQITGVEGYTESAAMGVYVATQILRKFRGLEPLKWPVDTAIGALVNYVMTCNKPVPSNINFGLLPPVPLNKEQRRSKDRKKIKKLLASKRAQESFQASVASLT